MFYQIQNTPERVRRAREAVKVPKEAPIEKCPRLVLAPFSRSPQVIFDNVLIGSSYERNLELFNPSKQIQQITLGKALPPGLVIELPGECVKLKPETCHFVRLLWTPTQPTNMRDTIRFTNENRSRYDVIVVLKSIKNIKGKNQPEGFKTSPCKMKKKSVSNKSPVSFYKEKAKIIYNTTTRIQETVNVVQSTSTQHKVYQTRTEELQKPKKSKSFAKPKEYIGSKINTTYESDRSINRNLTINQIGNIYSQSFTVDPFQSTTYFYDEEAVVKIEFEFKRWLNCILTPPADLDSIVEQKVDVGKAWIENRNKEVPLAPTKEQVCNVYHNSHRLASLRKSARALLVTPEIAQVFQKLRDQIDKKLIAIRTDRNLHLDVGLQKTIMELILSYNPLWLRIGLEAIYNKILPLKSNNDIKGLTTFVIQNMFKNPNLKHKHSKSIAPNVLLPAYMSAIKKFTLKKFFMLVFFLDQAKQRKLIQHDPCLFCRNAICKESREIVIRFTREVIAGIGDINKHLRPTGYVVYHKQSYLDEYKYAVHNLALDIKDGVRLTKVMEIILIKNGLLNQLRTPAISRLQKIHNVQVAMNAMKDANFTIEGDITPADIADGHREKTLSLLWQLIHVFRAPLFEKAANVIQIWWKKKYKVVVEQRRLEEKARMRLTNAASIIQYWWRRIQYNRQVKWQMQQVTTATIVLQRYCRMWICRTRLRKLKTSVLKIETWYRSIKTMRGARMTLENLWRERQELHRKSAVVIQCYVRRWLCMKRYNITVWKIVHLQSSIRRFIGRSQFLRLKESVTFIQQKYRAKLLMRHDMRKLAQQKRSVVLIQSYFRMYIQRRSYLNLKKFVQVLEDCYIALLKMREERKNFLELKRNVIAIQTLYRSKKCHVEYTKQRNLIISLQRKFRANQLMKHQRAKYLQTRNAVIILQKYTRLYLTMNKIRQTYTEQRKSTVLIQSYFRSYLLAKSQRKNYLMIKNKIINVQQRFRSLLLMRKERSAFMKLKSAAVLVQRQYRAQVEMRKCKESYNELRNATLLIQHKYRALIKMREQRSKYLQLKASCVTVQNAYRAYALGKRERAYYHNQKQAAITVQNWFRNCKKGKKVQEQFKQTKQACVTIQTYYKSFIIGRQQRQEYIKIKTATICIQKFYRSYIETRTIRQQFTQIKSSTVKIQRFYKSRLTMKEQRKAYLQMKSAVSCIEAWYQRYKEYQMIRKRYLELRKTTIYIQTKYRSIVSMRLHRCEYLKLKQSIITVQQRYRALMEMKTQRKMYKTLRAATITLQTRYRAQRLMKNSRISYITTVKACVSIQRFYRAYVSGSKQRKEYLKLKQATINLQMRYRALLAMRKERKLYITKQKATVCIQKNIRRYLVQSWYRRYREKTVFVQKLWREKLHTRLIRFEYNQKRRFIIRIQSVARGYLTRKWVKSEKENIFKIKEEKRQYWAASRIQALFRGHKARKLIAHNTRVADLRRRLREASLDFKERHDEAILVLGNTCGIERVINAFRSLQLQTEVFPMLYNDKAVSVVRRVYYYMSVMNRSISNIEVLKSAAAVLVNLARYRKTGPKIYDRKGIDAILRFMLRFSVSETQLFCILATYIWLFSKYDDAKRDLAEYLHIPENHKKLVTMKVNVERVKRMKENISRNKFSHTNSRNLSISSASGCASNRSIVLPAVEPDYGIVKEGQPKYFEDAQQALNCLFRTFKL